MTTKEEIQARIEKSNKSYQLRKLEQEAKQTDIKEGRIYMHQNKLPVCTERFDDDSILAITVEKNEFGGFFFAYALCSPKDQFSLKTAKGLLGLRLKNRSDFVFTTDVHCSNPKQILQLGLLWLEKQSLNNNKSIPDRLRKTIKEESDYHWGIDYHGLK